MIHRRQNQYSHAIYFDTFPDSLNSQKHQDLDFLLESQLLRIGSILSVTPNLLLGLVQLYFLSNHFVRTMSTFWILVFVMVARSPEKELVFLLPLFGGSL